MDGADDLAPGAGSSPRRAAPVGAPERPCALELRIPVDAAASAELTAALWEAIDALPEKLRITIVLSAIEGHDVADVARLLDLPEGTVKSRLYHARRQLQERCNGPAD